MADKLPTTVSEVLVKALEIFGEHGEHWNNYTIHSTRRGEDTYCALGAIGRASTDMIAGGGGWGTGVGKQAAEHLAETLGRRPDYCEIPDWNDAKPRGLKGFTQIKAGFCKAIKSALDKEKPAATPSTKGGARGTRNTARARAR